MLMSVEVLIFSRFVLSLRFSFSVKLVGRFTPSCQCVSHSVCGVPLAISALVSICPRCGNASVMGSELSFEDYRSFPCLSHFLPACCHSACPVRPAVRIMVLIKAVVCRISGFVRCFRSVCCVAQGKGVLGCANS